MEQTDHVTVNRDSTALVYLTTAELEDAESIGEKRFNDSRDKGRKPKFDTPDSNTNDAFHKLGAVGELAFAKAIDVTWSRSFCTFTGEPDVADYDVRTTFRRDGELPIRPSDAKIPDRPVALVCREDRHLYRVVGYFYPRDVRPEHWRPTERNPYHAVPHRDLYKFDPAIFLGALEPE